MPRGNSEAVDGVLRRVERAKELLDEVAALVKKGKKGKKGATKGAARVSSHKRAKTADSTIDFSTPIRAFIKKHALGMNGAKKFTLLVACLTKGDASKRVALADIERHWNKMTAKSLLGMAFNPMYSARAREHDWVNTEKAGSYYLRPGWKEIF